MTQLPPHPVVTERSVIVGVGASAGGEGRRVVAEVRGVVVAGETDMIVVGGVENITRAHLLRHTVARVMNLLLLQKR